MTLAHRPNLKDRVPEHQQHPCLKQQQEHRRLKQQQQEQVKGHIKANNRLFKLDEVERLAWEGFEVVTPERWSDLVKHVRNKVEDHYWKADRLDRQFVVSEFVIHYGGESSDESSDDEATSELATTSNPVSLNSCVANSDSDEDI